MGINTVLFVAQQGLTSKKKTPLKAYEVFLQDEKKKKREKLPDWRFGLILSLAFVGLNIYLLLFQSILFECCVHG